MRIQRLSGAVLAATLATAGLSVISATPASAAMLGQVATNVSSGTDSTLFGGSVIADCPANTGEAAWSMEGPSIPPQLASLGPGAALGEGPQQFSGASIANIKSGNPGSFTTNSVYKITFFCQSELDSSITDTYEADLNYTAGGAGSWNITRQSATTLTAAPTSATQGGSVTLTADVTPAFAQDNATGSVEFFNGVTSLGTDNAFDAGGIASLATSALPVGSNNVTAVFTPTAGTGVVGSTSSAVTVTVTGVLDRATATTLTAAPSTVTAGDSVALTADVTPATGADNATGSVEFFNGATSIGIDNILTADGVATLATTTLPVGGNTITAVFTPAAGSGVATSTSPATTVTVNAAITTPTTSALTVTPVSGPANQPTTLTCTVTASTGQAAGTANFTDNGAAIGSAPVTAGAPAVLTTAAASGAGNHSYVCNFVGTAPYTNSTSAAVTATFNPGNVDEQTITVTIPAGAITITTPYTPSSPLYLGVAVLDPATSTYSASAPFTGITITDTRAGNLGFTASLIAGAFNNGTSSFPGQHAGFTNVAAQQVPNNAMLASSVGVTNTPAWTPGIGTTTQFASYPAGSPTGSVNMTAVFSIAQVPTSVTPGLYTSTVTFTAV